MSAVAHPAAGTLFGWSMVADRRHELLRRPARGEWIGAIALSEPDARSDLASVSTRAVLEGDEWVVIERSWRDARLTTILEDTSGIQKRSISDRLLPRSPLN